MWTDDKFVFAWCVLELNRPVSRHSSVMRRNSNDSFAAIGRNGRPTCLIADHAQASTKHAQFPPARVEFSFAPISTAHFKSKLLIRGQTAANLTGLRGEIEQFIDETDDIDLASGEFCQYQVVDPHQHV